MTYHKFVTDIARLLPDCSIGRDNDGQIIVYTGKTTNGQKIVNYPDDKECAVPNCDDSTLIGDYCHRHTE